MPGAWVERFSVSQRQPARRDAAVHNQPSSRVATGTFLHRPGQWTQTECTVDQSDTAAGLGQIAQHPAASRTNLRGEQPHGIAPREEAVEQRASVRVTSLQYMVFHPIRCGASAEERHQARGSPETLDPWTYSHQAAMLQAARSGMRSVRMALPRPSRPRANPFERRGRKATGLRA